MRMPLADARRYAHSNISDRHGAEWAPTRKDLWQAPVPFDAAKPLAPKTLAIRAFVSEGRWVVACPDCQGAQLACETDPRFMCVTCANVTIDGMWRPVIWPKMRAAIEAELEIRPLGNQHWLPSEAVSDLRKENVKHGLVKLDAAVV